MEQITEILKIGKQVLAGKLIDWSDAERLAAIDKENLPFLLAMADKIRKKYIGDAVDICAIVNARSGRCSENCKYCAQSKHHATDVKVYPFMASEMIIKRAQAAAVAGANRFAIVTSGKGMEGDKEFPKILMAIKRILAETKLTVCCSLGALTPESAAALKAAGVSRYHHNIETSRANYPNVCTSHNYDDRLATIKLAKQAGLEVCVGGILGMNETRQDRLAMAFEIRQLGVSSIPLNILNPISGTAFAKQARLKPLEILQTFALFRFIVPKCGIRTAGGREVNLRDLQALALTSGINGIMIGDYLTTVGRNSRADQIMLSDLERPVVQVVNGKVSL